MASQPPPLSIRTRPEAKAAFERLRQELNRDLPYGAISRGELFEMIVASASALHARGELHVAAPCGPAPVDPDHQRGPFRTSDAA